MDEPEIEVRYSNKGLYFWEGGCTWIEGEKSWIQLRTAFEKRGRYLGYNREEIVAHEKVHLLRKDFEEPIFEEILAYQMSPSPFHRFFGPLIRSSKEIFLFLALICLAPFQPLFYLGALLLAILGMGRLVRNQRIFSLSKLKISEIVGKERAFSILLRLKDREIIATSKMEREELAHFLFKRTLI